jgi:hypothetical protein
LFDITNINYYDVILGTPFLRKMGINLDFSGQGCIRLKGETIHTNKDSVAATEPSQPLNKGMTATSN